MFSSYAHSITITNYYPQTIKCLLKRLLTLKVNIDLIYLNCF